MSSLNKSNEIKKEEGIDDPATSNNSNSSISVASSSDAIDNDDTNKANNDDSGDVMVLCLVKAGGVNPVDAKFLYGDKVPHIIEPIVKKFLENRICGIDFSGVVLEICSSSPSSCRFKVGDEVFGTMPPSFGSFAEFVVCPTHSLCLKPKNFSFEQAAAIPLVGLTAYQAFIDNGIRKGDHVCILGASGGTGHVAVQIARALGARVTGVCSLKNVHFVHELDADDVIAYDDNQYDLFEKLKEICLINGKFDLVFDSVSSHDSKDNSYAYYHQFKLYELIHERGMYINLGGDSFDWLKAHIRRFFKWNLFNKGHELFWIRFPHSSKDLEMLKQLCEQSKLRVKVAHRFPLTTEGMQTAFELQLSRRVKGKIVISN